VGVGSTEKSTAKARSFERQRRTPRIFPCESPCPPRSLLRTAAALPLAPGCDFLPGREAAVGRKRYGSYGAASCCRKQSELSLHCHPYQNDSFVFCTSHLGVH
jgi:hypothetical protein